VLTWVGKRPAVIAKEVPGFVGNRLQMALLREALAIVEQGIATPQDVDTIIKTGFGRRLAAAGVFEIFDIGGWDLLLAVAEQIQPSINASPEVSAPCSCRIGPCAGAPPEVFGLGSARHFRRSMNYKSAASGTGSVHVRGISIFASKPAFSFNRYSRGSATLAWGRVDLGTHRPTRRAAMRLGA